MISKRPRPGSTPQEEGRRFEKFWAKLFGVEPKRGSGSVWYAKLDVGDVAFLFSCKHTTAESFSVSKKLLREVDQAVTGPGGVGGEIIPALAVAIDNGAEVLVSLRAEDLLRLIQSDSARYITPSRGEQKRSRAKIPNLLREED